MKNCFTTAPFQNSTLLPWGIYVLRYFWFEAMFG